MKTLTIAIVALAAGIGLSYADKLVVHPEYLGYDAAQPHHPTFKPPTMQNANREGMVKLPNQ